METKGVSLVPSMRLPTSSHSKKRKQNRQAMSLHGVTKNQTALSAVRCMFLPIDILLIHEVFTLITLRNFAMR
jgi:hypothetical protein